MADIGDVEDPARDSGGGEGSRAPDPAAVASPQALIADLDKYGYLADEALATACFLALRMRRPLFLEGDAGVGKTELARTLAAMIPAPLIRLQCYEGLGVAQALYDWDFPRQLLHVRAAEAAGAGDPEQLEGHLYDRRFLVARPILRALETTPSVLLIDEIDRADDEFEAFLLEVLSDFSITIPELGVIRAKTPPVVVITSNRSRDVHDALKRRCLYHWVEHPSFDREVAIIRRRQPLASERLARDVAGAAQALRGADLIKPPGVAESVDWAEALISLGAGELDEHNAQATIGALVKYREDVERVRHIDWAELIATGRRHDA